MDGYDTPRMGLVSFPAVYPMECAYGSAELCSIAIIQSFHVIYLSIFVRVAALGSEVNGVGGGVGVGVLVKSIKPSHN